MAIMCNALLAARSPPRLSRCLTVLPDEAGKGPLQSPTDPNAKIARMKDRSTHLAFKPEHAVDLDTGGWWRRRSIRRRLATRRRSIGALSARRLGSAERGRTINTKPAPADPISHPLASAPASAAAIRRRPRRCCLWRLCCSISSGIEPGDALPIEGSRTTVGRIPQTRGDLRRRRGRLQPARQRRRRPHSGAAARAAKRPH